MRNSAKAFEGTHMRRASLRVVAVMLSAACVATGCTLGSSDEVPPKVVVVAAPPGPDTRVLAFVKDTLAADAGLDLRVRSVRDSAAAAAALGAKRVDAALGGSGGVGAVGGADRSLAFVAPVHLSPLGLYAAKPSALAHLDQGGEVLVPDDPVLAGRALRILADHKLIGLRAGAGPVVAAHDVTANPHHVRITRVPSDQLVERFPGVTAVVMPASTARTAKIGGARVVAWEKARDNPFAEGLVVRARDERDPEVVKLAEILRSDDVRSFLAETYGRTVVPAF